MTAPMPRQKNNLTPSQMAGQQIVGSIAKRRFDWSPFLIRKALDMIKSAAANNPNPMLRHARFYSNGCEIRRELLCLSPKGEGDPGNRIALTNLLLTTNPTILMAYPALTA